MPIDPVCGMKIKAEEAPSTSVYKGKTYYFCSETCKDEFDQAPEDFVEEEREF